MSADKRCTTCGNPKCAEDHKGRIFTAGHWNVNICHGHAEPQPSRSVQRRVAAQKGEPTPTFEETTSVDLTGLIECISSIDCDDDDDWCSCRHHTQAERDEIVLALRVLRVLRTTTSESTTTIYMEDDGASCPVVFDSRVGDGTNYMELDEAERLLGLADEGGER